MKIRKILVSILLFFIMFLTGCTTKVIDEQISSESLYYMVWTLANTDFYYPEEDTFRADTDGYELGYAYICGVSSKEGKRTIQHRLIRRNAITKEADLTFLNLVEENEKTWEIYQENRDNRKSVYYSVYLCGYGKNIGEIAGSVTHTATKVDDLSEVLPYELWKLDDKKIKASESTTVKYDCKIGDEWITPDTYSMSMGESFVAKRIDGTYQLFVSEKLYNK